VYGIQIVGIGKGRTTIRRLKN